MSTAGNSRPAGPTRKGAKPPRRRIASPGVPTFSLYGEGETPTDAEFVHVEDIASRSRLYDWQIGSHAHHGLYQIVLVADGAAQVRIDDAEIDATGPAAITIAPGVVHGFRFSPGTRGYVLTIAEARLTGSLGASLGPSFEELLGRSGVIDLAPTPDAATRIASTLEHLSAEFRWPLAGRAMMLDWLVRTCLLLIVRRQAAATRATRAAGSREDVLSRFRALIETHYREHWSIGRYAKTLHVTEGRLNRICRDAARRSALDLVQDRLVLEARRRLIYIAMPVALLGEELGFKDPAYFSRFFKRMTGSTPSAFRRAARRSWSLS